MTCLRGLATIINFGLTVLSLPVVSRAQVLYIGHISHQHIIYIRQKQISAGEGLLKLVPQLIDQLFDCAWRRGNLDQH